MRSVLNKYNMSFVFMLATVVATAPIVQDTARTPRTTADSAAAPAPKDAPPPAPGKPAGGER